MSKTIRKFRTAIGRPFWGGFFLGISGPVLMFAPPPRAQVDVHAVSTARAWRDVGGYIRKGIDSERPLAKARRDSSSNRT